LVFAVLGAMGMAIIYGLKVNLSVTMVAMLNHTGLEAMKTDHHDAHGTANDHNGSLIVNDATVCEAPKDEHGVQQKDEVRKHIKM
jgi:hypothetical protein